MVCGEGEMGGERMVAWIEEHGSHWVLGSGVMEKRQSEEGRKVVWILRHMRYGMRPPPPCS